MAVYPFGREAAAATVFLVVYTALFIWMVTGYISGRYKVRSRWSLLMFHVTVRVASQGLGVAFALIGFSNINLFVAYLIMNAEGFFTISIATWMFLKAWQKHNWGDSWLASDKYKVSMGHAGHFILAPLLAPWKYRHHIMKPVHALLMVSNILIIVGGAMLSNAYDVTDAQPLTSATDQENTAKVLRTVGSAVFLGAAVFWSACLFKTIATNRSEGSSIHSTLVLLVIAGAFLIARGTFGMLQSCLYSGLGVAFALMGFSNINLFIAYLIMNAEGFFTLSLAGWMFLKAWQKHNWGDSWLSSDKYQVYGGRYRYFVLAPLFAPWKYRHHLMHPVHALLVPANVMIIVGGAMLSDDYDVTDEQPLTSVTDQEQTAKILRSVGAAMFLAVAVFWNACLYKSIATQRSGGGPLHGTLAILSVVGVFLLVRGTFGLLQSCLYSLSYINPKNYNEAGFTNTFLALEYALAVTMEFACALLLNLTHFTSKQDKYVNSRDIPSSDSLPVTSPGEEKDNDLRH